MVHRPCFLVISLPDRQLDAMLAAFPGGNSRLKVMPLTWVYGGNDPQAGNPILEKCSVPPRP